MIFDNLAVLFAFATKVVNSHVTAAVKPTAYPVTIVTIVIIVITVIIIAK